jgi:hypothetical protein
MKTNFKKDNFSEDVKQDISTLNKTKVLRPNIDHLIKKILVERRKQDRKNFFIFSFILFIAAGSVLISYIY